MRGNIEFKELKEYFVTNEITNSYSVNSFKKFFFFLKIFFRRDFWITEEFDTKDNLVKEMFLYYKDLANSYIEKVDYGSFIETSKLANQDLFGMAFYKFISNNKTKGNNNLTIIQCPCRNSIRNIIKFYNTDFLIFPHPEVTKDLYDFFIEQLENDSFRNYKFDYVERLSQLVNIEEEEKKDNIIIKLSMFNSIHILYSISQLKFPEWFITVTCSLNKLKKGGNLFLGITHLKTSPAYQKLFEILLNCFEDYYYDPRPEVINYGSILLFYNFKDNLSNQIYNRMKKISSELVEYDYKIYDYYVYMNYHKEINYLIKDFDINVPEKKIMIVEDIDIKPETNQQTEKLMYELNEYFDSQIDLTNLYMDNYIYEENGILKAETKLFSDLAYFRVINRVNILYDNNTPINKTLLVYIDKFNKENITRLLKYNTSAKNFIFELKDTICNKPMFNLSDFEIYSYKDFDFQQKMINDENEFREREKARLGIDDKINLSYIFEEFEKELPSYINQKFNLTEKITSTFTKFWEIYKKFPFLTKNKTQLKSLHFGKNSQETIYCTRVKLGYNKEFLWKTNNREGDIDFYKNNEDKYIETEEKYDTYTGLKFFEKKFKKDEFNIITCDEISDSDNLTKIQKLEFSKLMMVLLTASKGSHTVIRHLLPFQLNVSQSSKSSGFFINLVYIYQVYFEKIYFYKPVSSSNVKPEVYIIGKNFKGMKESRNIITILENKSLLDIREEIDILFNTVKFFKKNCCIYEKISMDEEFVKQIYDNIKILYNSMLEEVQTEYILLTCINSKDPKIRENTGCTKIFEEEYKTKTQILKFKKWIKEFNF